MRNNLQALFLIIAISFCSAYGFAQQGNDTTEKKHKNIVRYNLSSGLLFGIDKYVVLGYERIIKPHQSFSVNVGRASLPKLISIDTDSFDLKKDTKNSGFNISGDYRFYLAKETKFNAPHGIYIGPYYSYSHFIRENEWNYQKNNSSQEVIQSSTTFNIHTFGAEMGYQFILWKRLALDFVMIGPGFSYYDLKATISENLPEEKKTQLRSAIKQLISQKIPGMNYTLSDQEFNSNGTIRTLSIGYRYLIHIGYNF